ncbi:DUF4863 family protein [Rhizobium jaguaris]|uniref:DUF4863 family protein n=1 Tax=Rhizobium jaguaris TaxID=1312183 RepID=UPI0013C4B5CC
MEPIEARYFFNPMTVHIASRKGKLSADLNPILIIFAAGIIWIPMAKLISVCLRSRDWSCEARWCDAGWTAPEPGTHHFPYRLGSSNF